MDHPYPLTELIDLDVGETGPRVGRGERSCEVGGISSIGGTEICHEESIGTMIDTIEEDNAPDCHFRLPTTLPEQ